eukprot:3750480-Pleurochrysis_carterae.AAC.1
MDSRQGNGGNAHGGQGCPRCALVERRRRPRAAVWRRHCWVRKTVEDGGGGVATAFVSDVLR